MWVWGDREACCRSLYSGTVALRLCGRRHKLVAAVLSALVVSGCSYRLSSLSSQDDGDPPTTGSIAAPARHAQSANAAPRQVEQAHNQARGQATDRANDLADDLAYARAAVSDALARAGKDSSVPWQNPDTGAGGNITPLATLLYRGRSVLPRFPRQLCPRRLAGLAARGGLPHGSRRLGDTAAKAPRPRLGASSPRNAVDSLVGFASCPRLLHCVTATLCPHWRHLGGRGRPEAYSESFGDA